MSYPLEYILQLGFGSLLVFIWFGRDAAHGSILRVGVEQGISLRDVSC